MKQPVVSCNPEIMDGAPVFAGTRVPVQTLLDYLEAGDSIDEFLEGFPSVAREHVVAFLEATPHMRVGKGAKRRAHATFPYFMMTAN